MVAHAPPTAEAVFMAEAPLEVVKANLCVRRCPRTGYGSVHGEVLSDLSRVDLGHDFGIEFSTEIKPAYMVHCGVSRDMKGPLVEVDIPEQAKTIRIALGIVSDGHISVSVSTEHRRSHSDGPLAASQESNASDGR